jgi:hypothetical protein
MRLHEQVKSLREEVDALRGGVMGLKFYLSSDKFRDDTTVQVSDVLRRLREIENEADWMPLERGEPC